MTKYDWSNVPKEVKWIATDPGDLEIWFKDEPYLESLLGWVGDEYSMNSPSNYKGNWQDSLEERPSKSDLPETVVKSLGEVA
ncbi:hypothetical protein [Acinetobacter guillouiae]|uniref:hypothetical protein n=1 Tax=Acinetobacter guillouiae TaxID=106649 RepID=UPI003AF9BB16